MEANSVRIVQMVEGRLVASDFPLEQIEDAMTALGQREVGRQPAEYSPGKRYCEEIIGQPIFSGFCGPMYGGEGIVRYEDQASNDVLSA